MVFKNKSPLESIGLQFWVAYTAWHANASKELKPLNINHTQFVILASILWCKSEGETSNQSDIMHITGLDKMALSKSIRSLESKGLITKSKKPNDSRAFTLNLTANGENITRKALTIIETLDQEHFGHITKNKKLFISLLKGIRE